MASPPLKELLALDVASRLALVQELWDSIVNDARDGELPVSDHERRELDERLKEDDTDPSGAISWADAREALHRAR